MNNQQRLYATFASGLGIEPATVNDQLAYNSLPQWDSVAHMGLVATLEQEFDVMLDTDDIIDLSSVAKAREILERHGISF
jgi:acyl carrier protein